MLLKYFPGTEVEKTKFVVLFSGVLIIAALLLQRMFRHSLFPRLLAYHKSLKIEALVKFELSSNRETRKVFRNYITTSHRQLRLHSSILAGQFIHGRQATRVSHMDPDNLTTQNTSPRNHEIDIKGEFEKAIVMLE
jgi:hypothetical protein